MNWIDEALNRLAQNPLCGYGHDQPPATEPSALAALALTSHGLLEPASQVGQWLQSLQDKNGTVGVARDAPTPHWPTSLAVLTWLALSKQDDPATANNHNQTHIERAIASILFMQGTVQPQGEVLGHNTMLVAWPWAEGTHSWIEPTALHLLALKATGHNQHDRSREAVRMLIDRQLPTGGCNYGNTTVLGQTLRPQLQPTGVAMLALAGEKDTGRRIERSLNYLHSTLSSATTTNSLCWGLMGLVAHHRFLKQADEWLAAAYGRWKKNNGSYYQLALLTLAGLKDRSPLITLPCAAQEKSVKAAS